MSDTQGMFQSIKCMFKAVPHPFENDKMPHNIKFCKTKSFFSSRPYTPGPWSTSHKSSTANKLEELSLKLRQQLDRSIARHLDKGTITSLTVISSWNIN